MTTGASSLLAIAHRRLLVRQCVDRGVDRGQQSGEISAEVVVKFEALLTSEDFEIS